MVQLTSRCCFSGKSVLAMGWGFGDRTGELLTEIAIMLFQQERLTLGQASLLARKNQLEFQRLLASRQIPLHYDVAELREDMENLKANSWR